MNWFLSAAKRKYVHPHPEISLEQYNLCIYWAMLAVLWGSSSLFFAHQQASISTILKPVTVWGEAQNTYSNLNRKGWDMVWEQLALNLILGRSQQSKFFSLDFTGDSIRAVFMSQWPLKVWLYLSPHSYASLFVHSSTQYHECTMLHGNPVLDSLDMLQSGTKPPTDIAIGALLLKRQISQIALFSVIEKYDLWSCEWDECVHVPWAWTVLFLFCFVLFLAHLCFPFIPV